ncbi:MAG TPA: hypothetical protein EYQ21_06105, partial [Flavobacteriales bacterium]|nr:hypothetical protein [Flavobacteriales bacterium]
EFLEEVFNCAGLDPYKYLQIDERLKRPQEVPFLLGDNSKAKKVLGWKPKYGFKSLLLTESKLDLILLKYSLKYILSKLLSFNPEKNFAKRYEVNLFLVYILHSM